jgi:hypothetical protein
MGICMHPQVIGRGHRLAMLDRLTGVMAERGVVFESYGDYARRWRAANPLTSWVEGESVHARGAREAMS